MSEGIYASLNGGIGSRDAPDKVRENRARMAAALGVAPTHFVSCYQIHSPDVIVAETPWTRENAPRADAHRDARAGPRDRRVHRRLRPGAVRGRARPAWSAPRMRAGRARSPACSKRRSPRWKSSAPRRARHRRRARAADPPAELRGRRGVRRPLHGGGRCEREILRARRRRPDHAMFDLPGYIRRGSKRRNPRASRTSGSAPMRTRSASSATAAPRTGPSRITAVTSTRLPLMPVSRLDRGAGLALRHFGEAKAGTEPPRRRGA